MKGSQTSCESSITSPPASSHLPVFTASTGPETLPSRSISPTSAASQPDDIEAEPQSKDASHHKRPTKQNAITSKVRYIFANSSDRSNVQAIDGPCSSAIPRPSEHTLKQEPKNVKTNNPIETQGLRSSRRNLLRPRIRSMLKRVGIEYSTDQVHELAAGRCPSQAFTTEERHTIESAACFLGASQPGSDAYILYFILLALEAESPAPSLGRLRHLKACAIMAEDFEDSIRVHELLLRELDLLHELEHTEDECLLLRITLALVSGKLRKAKPFEHQLPRIEQTLADPEILVAVVRTNAYGVADKIVRDVQNYYIISHVCRERVAIFGDALSDQTSVNSISLASSNRSTSFNLRLLRAELLRHWFVGPSPKAQTAQMVYLRDCLQKCYSILNPWNWFNKVPWQLTLAQEHLDLDVSATVGVFWLMWTQWPGAGDDVEQMISDGPDFPRCLGITSAELLWHLVELALSTAPKETKRSRSARIFGKDYWECLRHASAGFQKLSKIANADLAERFLDRLASPDRVANGATSARQMLLSMKVFKLGTETCDSSCSTSDDWLQHPAFHIASSDPAMRSSDTGSELSSMRRHKRFRARVSTSTHSSGRSLRRLTAGVVELYGGQSLFDLPQTVVEMNEPK